MKCTDLIVIPYALFQSHFSVKKGAAALGIGTDSVILIKCDERYARTSKCNLTSKIRA